MTSIMYEPSADNLPYEKVGKETRCIADEVPFDIPDSWEWVRLKEIIHLQSGQDLIPEKYSETSKGIPYITGASNFEKGTIIINRWTEYAKAFAYAGDLLITCKGTVGEMAFLLEPQAHIARQVMAISSPFHFNLCYVKLFISSYVETLISVAKSMIPGIARDDVLNIIMAVPPLAEQKCIVEKYEELLPLLAEYDVAETKATKLNAEFPDQLKKSILQWAIQGKLVPQDSADEPASVLLERIRAEKARLVKAGKIKKDKHESIIFRRDNSHYEKLDGIERCIDDEIPFEIPDSWAWTRMCNVVNIVSARRVHQADWRNTGIPFYRAREIGALADYDYVDNELFISKDLYTDLAKNGLPHTGDIMITAVGTLGKTYVVKATDKFYYKDASVICLENLGSLPAQFLKQLIDAPLIKTQIKINSAGTTVGTITIEKARNYLIPIPPLAEQKRIVAKIEELLSTLDKI